MDRGAWWARVHGVTKSQTRLSDFTIIFPNVKIHQYLILSVVCVEQALPWIK